MPNFKIGDRVVCKDSSTPCYELEGSIISTQGDSFFEVNFPGWTGGHNGSSADVMNSRYNLPSSSLAFIAFNFRVGDIVCTTDKIGIVDNVPRQTQFTILRIPDYATSDGRYTIKKTEGGDYLHYQAIKQDLVYPNILNINNSNKEATMPVTTEKKTVCDINFTRVNGVQMLNIKTTKEIADLFRSPEGVSVSENYLSATSKKLKYQKEIPNLIQFVDKFRRQSYSMACKLDRYGTNLIVDGAYNFSILRTDKIEDGITVKVGDLILEDDVTNWVQGLAAFLKFLHRNFIDKVEVKATITMNL